MPMNNMYKTCILILQLPKDNLRIGTIPQRYDNLKRLLLHTRTLIIIIIILQTLPKIIILTIPPQYLLNDMTDDQPGRGIGIAIEKQDLIMRLLLDLLG